jgi:hypothetical protein
MQTADCLTPPPPPAHPVQVPALNIFETSFRRGKFDESRKLSNGGMLDFAHIYPMDAVFDTPDDVPEEVCGEGQAACSCLWKRRMRCQEQEPSSCCHSRVAPLSRNYCVTGDQ